MEGSTVIRALSTFIGTREFVSSMYDDYPLVFSSLGILYFIGFLINSFGIVSCVSSTVLFSTLPDLSAAAPQPEPGSPPDHP